MYEHNRLVVRAVGMSVILRRLPVGRPAGMADPARPRHCQPSVCFLREDLQASFGLHHFDPACLLIAHGNAGRVISSVFQLLKSREQDRSRRLLACKSYDSTHVL